MERCKSCKHCSACYRCLHVHKSVHSPQADHKHRQKKKKKPFDFVSEKCSLPPIILAKNVPYLGLLSVEE